MYIGLTVYRALLEVLYLLLNSIWTPIPSPGTNPMETGAITICIYDRKTESTEKLINCLKSHS